MNELFPYFLHMFNFLYRYIYLTFVWVFVFVLFYQKSFIVDISSFIIVLYLILLLPLFDAWIEILKIEFGFTEYKKNVVSFYYTLISSSQIAFILKSIKKILRFKIVLFFSEIWKKFLWFLWKQRIILFSWLLLYILYQWNTENIYNFLTLSILVLSIIFSLDSRISFLIALCLLLLIPLFLILEKKDLAETYSIYAYYFLVIWVVVSLYESIYNKKKKQEKIATFFKIFFQKLWKILLFIKNNPIIVFYDLLIVFFLYFVGSIYFDLLRSFLLSLFQFMLTLYVIFKVFWFYFDRQIFDKNEKLDVGNFSYLNYIILFFAFNIIIFTGLLQLVGQEISVMNIYVYALVLLIIFLAIFSNISEKIITFVLKNVYITLTIGLILSILTWLYYKESIEKILKNTTSNYIVSNITQTGNTLTQTPSDEVILPVESKIENNTWSLSQTWEIISIWVVNTGIINTETTSVNSEIVFDISMFQENLWVWSTGSWVKILQKYLVNEGYSLDITGEYTKNTQSAMALYLSEKCFWKPTNQWILGPQARECIQKNLK